MEPLRRRADFEQVFVSGEYVRGRCLALRFVVRGEGPSRIGFAVGKRVDSRAVFRNRVRRRLRAAIRLVPVQEGYDIVVMGRRAALGADFASLKEDVRGVFDRAGLLEEGEA